MVFVKAIRDQMAPPRVEWWCKQPHLSSTVQARRFSLFGHIVWMPDKTDIKKILTASTLENWRRPLGRLRTTWMKTIQQDLKSKNLSLNETIDVAQNHRWIRFNVPLNTV